MDQAVINLRKSAALSFEKHYGTAPDGVVFCPYRICPVGAHIDHQHGKVTGFAINYGICAAYSVNESEFSLSSEQFPLSVSFPLDEVPEYKQNDWADYLRGAVIELRRLREIRRGMNVRFCASLPPIGGLSSSAAVVISFMKALCLVNSVSLSEGELINAAKMAENNYVGVKSGILDQSCEVLSEKGKLLLLDTENGAHSLVSPGEGLTMKLLLISSGVARTLASSRYNLRVDECKAAAYALSAYQSGENTRKFADTYLRDTEPGAFARYGSQLPETWRRRAEHYYTESARVEEAVSAWERGDAADFGRIITASGDSSVKNYEAGCPELIRLHEIIKSTDNVLGTRFSGAGFGGCSLAFVGSDSVEYVKRKIKEKYLGEYLALRGSFAVYEAETSDGAHI